jgi:hypothetical protein
MSEPIFEISETGKNVLTCEDHEKVFSSKFKTLKTFDTELMTVNGDHYNHNLGYYPIFLHVGYLSTKPTLVGLVGQNTDDNLTNVIVNTTEISNDNMSEWAAIALVYIFIEQLA